MMDVLNQSITIDQLIQTIDLTLLDEYTSTEALSQLKKEGNQYQVAALCVYSHHLHELSKENLINLATVINFPKGNEDLDISLAAINKATELGAVEIDYVLPYRLYLSGYEKEALSQCHFISELCQQKNLTLKIIVETGAFSNVQTIYEISKVLTQINCHFIKTSTGKITIGATLPAASAILTAIRDTKSSCGIKISGGIKKPEQALEYAKLAELMLNKPIEKSWFRIGASSLLNELLKIK